MRITKTDDLNIIITMTEETADTKRISVKIGDLPADEVVVPAHLLKAQITDNGFVRHVLNFFIKD